MVYATKSNIILAVCALATIIYNEYIEFLSLRGNQWNLAQQELPAPSVDQVRVLFVGDPQIQGHENEAFLIGHFSRWDSDYYLKKHFEAAKSFLKPHVIIFMGDLLDQGSTSDDAYYKQYATRFKTIFQVPDNVLSIYLAGDNDVGGEEKEPISESKIQLFESVFAPMNEVLQYKHLQFFKLNLLPLVHAVPNENLDKEFQKVLKGFSEKVSPSTTKILLTHNAISTAMLHRHIRSGFVTHNLRSLMEYFFKIYPTPNDLIDRNFEGNVVMQENRVPTCSYRMGAANMGFAVAVFDKDGQMHYTLLWLPSRFIQLRRYFMLFVFIWVVFLFKWCRRRR